MYKLSVRDQYIRFCKTSYCCSNLPDYSRLSYRHQNYFLSGLLNGIWQSWNKFWRTFWLVHILGGEDRDKNFIAGTFPRLTINEAVYYILYVLGRRQSPSGSIGGSYLEPTWGDNQVIQTIASNFSHPSANFNNILNGFTIYGLTLKHMQIVRNASIHLDEDNMRRVKSDVLPYYSLSRINNPCNIMFSREISSGKIAIEKWQEELIAYLLLI